MDRVHKNTTVQYISITLFSFSKLPSSSIVNPSNNSPPLPFHFSLATLLLSQGTPQCSSWCHQSLTFSTSLYTYFLHLPVLRKPVQVNSLEIN
uniref:Uncharacterized protein n=1 Tax=Octopus bimaculoides TaxID=37653 RepID=A0A0L8HPL0_OCTBM